MRRRPPMHPDTRRKFRAFLAMSYGILVLIGLQLWLHYKHQHVAELVEGVVVLACVAGVFIWARRAGFTRRPPRE